MITSAINKGTEPYGFQLKTQRTEAFWKNGIMFKGQPYKSAALILSAIDHDQSGFFGVNPYSGNEKRFYANFLYASIIGTTDHKFTTGLSYIFDDYKESYDQTLFIYNSQLNNDTSHVNLYTVNHTTNTIYNWNRTQSVPGAYFEYTYDYLEVFTLLAGIRADYDKADGVFITPRMNLRYAMNETTTLRASAGMGYRTSNIISENLSLLASQRSIDFIEQPKQEKAVNFGASFTKEFKVFGKKAEVDVDVYRTYFISQVMLDLDSLPTTAFVYNIHGKSFSNSYQLQLTYEPVKRFSLLMAYRINDVKEPMNGMMMPKPFVDKYKGLVNLSYYTNLKKWQFDFTSQFNGSARLPDQNKLPLNLQRAAYSPPYTILNAQITKKFKEFDAYVGCENLTNFTQKDPITEASRPYHTYFDTMMVWGPIVGRMIYAGLRFTVK